MSEPGIYGLFNTVSRKWYVGQSTDVLRRKADHLQSLRRGQHRNRLVRRSCKKYGAEAFEFHFLERVPEEMLDVRERAWINYYDSLDRRYGYNLESGGNSNKHHSPESRAEMSRTRKGRPLSPAQLANLDAIHKARKGHPLSPENCRGISEAKRGKRPAPGTMANLMKIAASRRGKLPPEKELARLRIMAHMPKRKRQPRHANNQELDLKVT